ncbi:MAG: hypothetical protein GY822_04805 [Deltaproteobacteria bacterium]|nr:hypothetical protein [Deltaproteobacteria bacterium]
MSSPAVLPHAFNDRLEAPVLREQNLRNRDLQGLDWSHRDLQGADLSGANLSDTLLIGANLSGARLANAILHEADLRGANLDGTDLTRADFSRANLGKATFRGASAIGANFRNSTLSHAVFDDANVQTADFSHARLLLTSMQNTDAHGAHFKKASIVGAVLNGACFVGADFSNAHMRQIRHFTKSVWFEVILEGWELTRTMSLKRHIFDEAYIRELQEYGKVARFGVWLWWVTSDCGRSFMRWGLWTFLVAVIFAGIYTQVSVDFGANETIISPFYFSIVTITSLGYGDVLPASMVAQIVVMSESIIGFCLLGGLISIMSNKIARRSE